MLFVWRSSFNSIPHIVPTVPRRWRWRRSVQAVLSPCACSLLAPGPEAEAHHQPGLGLVQVRTEWSLPVSDLHSVGVSRPSCSVHRPLDVIFFLKGMTMTNSFHISFFYFSKVVFCKCIFAKYLCEFSFTEIIVYSLRMRLAVSH